jgi:hypothetical protein
MASPDELEKEAKAKQQEADNKRAQIEAKKGLMTEAAEREAKAKQDQAAAQADIRALNGGGGIFGL